jgi:hypothetical protein
MIAQMTNSRATCARACQRKHKLRYIDGYRPVQTVDELRFGTLWHLGQEAWWNAVKAGVAIEARLASALAALSGEADPIERAKAEALLIGYHERWKGETHEVIGVEVPFETELRNPATGHPSRTWRLAGKLDLLLGSPNRIGEHKTTSEDISPGGDYWRRLRMDGQVSTYFAGAAALGYLPESCLYDVIRKPGIRPLKATPEENRKYTKAGALYAGQRLVDETPDEYKVRLLEDIAAAPEKYFARGTVVRLENELAEAQHDMWQLAQQIHESEIAGRFPRNPNACLMYGRNCEYWAYCTGEASLDDASLFRKAENVHPELEKKSVTPL